MYSYQKKMTQSLLKVCHLLDCLLRELAKHKSDRHICAGGGRGLPLKEESHNSSDCARNMKKFGKCCESVTY